MPHVKIQNMDTLLIVETDVDGRFTTSIPQETDKLLLSWIGMEWTTIKLLSDCGNLEVIMMYDVIYDFMTERKIDKLRMKRFKNLPKLSNLAFKKGLFLTKKPCYNQDFVSITEN